MVGGQTVADPPTNYTEATIRQAVALERIANTLEKMERVKVVDPSARIEILLEKIEGHQEVMARAALGPTYLEEYPEVDDGS